MYSVGTYIIIYYILCSLENFKLRSLMRQHSHREQPPSSRVLPFPPIKHHNEQTTTNTTAHTPRYCILL